MGINGGITYLWATWERCEKRDIRWNEECLAQRLGGVKDECLRRVLEIIA